MMTSLPILQTASSGPHGWHSREAWSRCPQYAVYRTVLKLVPREASVIRREGTLLHVALAHHYHRMRDAQAGQAPTCALPEEAVRFEAARLEAPQEEVATILACYDQYSAQHEGELRSVRVVLVEEVLRTEIHGRPYTQRIDLALEWPGRGVVLFDHKKARRIEKRTSAAHRLSGQIAGLWVLGREHYGRAFYGPSLNLVQLSPYKVERTRPEAAPALVASFRDRVKDIDDRRDQILGEIERGERDPFDAPKAMSETTCFGRYGACEYTSLCAHGKGMAAMYTREESPRPPATSGPAMVAKSQIETEVLDLT